MPSHACARVRSAALPINWSALEPTRSAFDDGYLDRVDVAVQCAAAAGMYVLIDVHQDAYSKEIGEDGAPLWAIDPPPQTLLGGPLTDLGSRRTSSQVTAAFDSFFDRSDRAGLQAEFMRVLDRVATRWSTDPAVIGFELFNEPPVGEADVDAFQFVAAARVRAAAPDKLVVFEPSAVRNLFDFVPRSTIAFPTTNAVYAPHIYTFVFYQDQTLLQNLQPSDLEASVAGARAEANAWHTPMLISEYGIGPTAPNADLWMGVQAQLHDRFLASDAFWLWKESSQASWGVFDHATAPDGSVTWIERPQIVAWVSRVHAARIAGTVVSNEYDYVTGSLRLEARGGGLHELYIPERAATSFHLTCNNVSVTAQRDATTGLVSVPCDGALVATP